MTLPAIEDALALMNFLLMALEGAGIEWSVPDDAEAQRLWEYIAGRVDRYPSLHAVSHTQERTTSYPNGGYVRIQYDTTIQHPVVLLSDLGAYGASVRRRSPDAPP